MPETRMTGEVTTATWASWNSPEGKLRETFAEQATQTATGAEYSSKETLPFSDPLTLYIS